MKMAIHIMFSSVLIFSILAPSVLNLCIEDKEVIALMDTSEDEKQEKTEKELEEKILQFDFLADENSFLIPKKKVAVCYLENNIDFSLEINLPPPKVLV